MDIRGKYLTLQISESVLNVEYRSLHSSTKEGMVLSLESWWPIRQQF